MWFRTCSELIGALAQDELSLFVSNLIAVLLAGALEDSLQ